MIIKNEGVVYKDLDVGLYSTCHEQMTIGGGDMATLLCKLEGILNKLTLAIVMQNFVGIEEFGVLLD